MNIKLTEYAKTSGWAAKYGPDVLAQVLCKIPQTEDENLLIGIDTSDDAAVYKINNELALIQTLDFFTPIVDDPLHYGRIAAANSLSDVYAMGGEPKIAMNIVCFPNCLDPEILGQILIGGHEKVKEAKCVLAGGHTVQDDEPKYGLSVSGFVHPNNIWTNSNCQEGDLLVLTKPIGTGIINTSLKGGISDKKLEKESIEIMEELNKYAKSYAEAFKINSCTDITGFGLAGHLYEMAKGSNCSINLFFKNIPIINGTLDLLNYGLLPEGAYNNKNFVGDNLEYKIKNKDTDVIFDPQTSGGLLLSLSKEEALKLNIILRENNINSAIIGEVKKFNEKYLYLV